MANLLLGPLLRWLGQLSHPRLFVVIGALFLVDLAIPNFVPWDDLFLGLGTLLLANWKKRKDPRTSDKAPIDSETRRR